MTGSATYSPEDNKIRLYVGRVPRADYERLRAAGFVSTPKQDCDFVATWTPTREDLAREFIPDDEDLGDEDYSPQERSADRAERFEGYRGKRANEAGAGADAFEAGPQAFGHQNLARAERQAARHDRRRVFAVSQWSKAEYWQQRTAGVIAHALHRSSPAVRRGRILTLEAEQRKHEKSRADLAHRYAFWRKVLELPGADEPIARDADGHYVPAASSPAGRLAYTLANGGSYSDYVHPRSGRKAMLYSLLTDQADPITPREAANLWLDAAASPDDPESYSARWSAHYALRIGYERAMLAEEGGTVTEADMEPGGWIRTGNRTGSVFTDVQDGWKQIQRVHKSPATGRVTSVQVWGTTTGFSAESDYRVRETKPALVTVNVERLGENAYRAPTPEEKAAFEVDVKARKAEAKAKAPKAPPLVNPTDEDAQRLQDLWNDAARAKHDKARAAHQVFSDFTPVEVERMTQAEYSRRSKGSFSICETRTLHAGGMLARASTNLWTSAGQAYDKVLGPAQCKVRIKGYSQPQVIVITDKPQKALPIAWERTPAAQEQAVSA